ncbi:SDR family NAD(P)-dependent oxidoreductase [Halobacterium sp. KA-6]|uniref:SDR family NAD(P)-dependent oxidoreductase n=1 Tax=Halobacterium sp. KA-6 TaxID=2896368 RepID=UPI001E5B913C|nr:SDR family oxidoreductase [Halobacterium sp. KA-6]MCD2203415.1 SDR family oxidoreductase [Halobacterium sp. KA-6]
MTSLDGKVCIVGGAGNGLGEATARALADHGATVVVNDLGTSVHGEGSDPAVAERVAKSIREDGGDATAHAGDLTEFAYADDLVADTVADHGRVDAVLNFAGILRDDLSYKLDAEDWQAVVETNLTGQFTLLQAACKHWRDAAGGDGFDSQRSYLAASAHSARGNVGQVNYAAAKAGILGMMRTVSSEMHRHGVRVNALVPNAYTRMTETVPEEHRPYTREEMPPERVAAFAAFLASDHATDVTGCALYAGGDRVGVFSEPTLDCVGIQPGGWSVEALAEHFEEDIAGDVDLTRTESFF